MSKRLDFDLEYSINILVKFPVLNHFDKKDLREILGQKGYAYIFKYTKGETLIYESTYDCWVFWLLTGKLNVTKRNQVLSILEKQGEVIGEMGPINEDPRSATLTALTDVTTFGLDLSILDQIPQEKRRLFHIKLKEIAIRRMNDANEAFLKAREELKMEQEKMQLMRQFIEKCGFTDQFKAFIAGLNK